MSATSYNADGGMSTLTAVLWISENEADVKFRADTCSVVIECRHHPNCAIEGSASGGPGAAFVAAVLKAALEHEAHGKVKAAP